MLAEFKGYTIQLESIRRVVGDIAPLHQQHYHETETKYLKHHAQIDYDGYGQLEAKGVFLCYTAREKATGQMVAYLMYFVARSLHMAANTAQEDAYYVAPGHRGTGLARQLLRTAELDLRLSHKIDYVFMSSKQPVGGPNIGPLLEIEGYSEMARVYCKQLET